MTVLVRHGSIVAALVAALFLIVGAASVQAESVGAPKLGIRLLDTSGAYVRLTMRPGETKQVRLELGNYGATRASARSYVADVYSMINGGMGVGLLGQPATGTTQWLAYPAKTLQLDPRQAVPETMTVAVPATAVPGEYISALVIEGDAGTSLAGDATFKQVDRQAVAVSIRVPGPIVPSLSLPTAALRTTPGGVTYLDLGVVNDGNLHLHLAGAYDLVDATGAQIAGGSVSMDTVYANTSTVLAVPITVAIAPGHYTVSLSLTDRKAPISASSGPLPIDIAAPVAPPASAASPTSAAAQSLTLDAGSLVVVALGMGLALGLAFPAAAYVIIRKRRRRERSVLSAQPL